jgi:hypothetical protein
LGTSTGDGSLSADKANTTWLNHLNESKNIELQGRLHADSFNSDRMLINGVDMNIKLTRAPALAYR